MIQDFEPGPAITFSLTNRWSEPVNSEVAGIHHPDFCVGTDADDTRPTVYVVLNGASVLEVGNEWRKKRDIPSDALVAVYLPVPLVPNWTAPGDICMKHLIPCPGGVPFAGIPIDDGTKSICIFWDFETWEFTGRSELRDALRFAELGFAAREQRESLLQGKGRLIRAGQKGRQ